MDLCIILLVDLHSQWFHPIRLHALDTTKDAFYLEMSFFKTPKWNSCHLIPSGVPTQQLGHGSKCAHLWKDLIGNKHICQKTRTFFQYLPGRGQWKNSLNIHGSSWLSHAFRRVLQFCPWWRSKDKCHIALEFSSSIGCIPSAPIRTSTPRSSMRLSISLFSEQNVLQMTSQNLEWKVMRTKFWATQLFPFQTFAISFLVKDISSLDNSPFHFLRGFW